MTLPHGRDDRDKQGSPLDGTMTEPRRTSIIERSVERSVVRCNTVEGPRGGNGEAGGARYFRLRSVDIVYRKEQAGTQGGWAGSMSHTEQQKATIYRVFSIFEHEHRSQYINVINAMLR